MRLRTIGLLLLLLAVIAFPLLFANPVITDIAALTMIYAVAATSWNIFSGYTGYIALGHAVFYGSGAYGLALMSQHWHLTGYAPLALLPLCGLIGAVLALPVGAIALRARGHAFVVITIAIFFITQLMAYNLRSFTYGSTGLSLPFPPWTGDFYYTPFFYIGLVVLLLALATSWFIRNSQFGLGLLAIRDDEDRARGLGVRTGISKLIAFVISAFFVGVVGGLWAYMVGSVAPATAFVALFDVALALVTFLGGAGTLGGPILGALIVIPSQLYFALEFGTAGFYLVIYGALFLVVLLLLPEGIIPTVRKRWAQRTARRMAPSVAAGGAPAPLPEPVTTPSAEGGER
jgi:branched-chain amino acid transport system permease protein